MSEGHEPGYYVNEGVDSFESGLWDGPGADEFDPYTRFDVDFDFEAAFGLTTSESAGLEVPDQAATDIEQTQEAFGTEKERNTSDSEAFLRSASQQPSSGTGNEAPTNSLDNFPDTVRSFGHMGQPPTFTTPCENSSYHSTSSSGRISHATALQATNFQEEEDAVKTSTPIGDAAWPAHAQYWSSENEGRVHDQQELSNLQNSQGNSGQIQFQSDLDLGHQNFGQIASDWEFPIEDFFGPIDTNAGLQQQPEFDTTARPLVIRDEEDDDPNDSDRDDEDDEDAEYDEEDDLPSQGTSVTYPVNDPMIVEDPIQKGWGRTGMRNGSEVWFNPRLYKWRKWSSLV